MDSPKPSIDVESQSLIRWLLRLYLGTSESSNLPAAEKTAPASPAVQLRILNLFAKSQAAANHFPETYEVASFALALRCVWSRGFLFKYFLDSRKERPRKFA